MHEAILPAISGPADIKKLSSGKLRRLAGEIRDRLISTVSRTGGHLAPNLGVVELTIALHWLLDCPNDKIIWDVGHQSYVHKLLTGRERDFSTLRTLDGISGFPKRCESQYDCFGTGHSSTSISAGLGMALARDLNGQKHHVVAVIGDGSLTGGLAYEALNYAGHLGIRLLVILNDNEMSIARNVGAMSQYLGKLRADPTYNRLRGEIEGLLRRIPAIGGSVVSTAEKIGEGIRHVVLPGGLFEELGFSYVGPVDGHDIDDLLSIIGNSLKMPGPVLLHVATRKGRGYRPAEEKADTFHGIGPFCVESGKVLGGGGSPSYTAVFSDVITAIGALDRDVVAITAAMPEGTGLKQFAQAFPQRFFDVGIAEQQALTMAAGLAAAGKKPVVAVYSTFAQRGYDQIVHDICLQNLPVTIALDRAGVVGEDGPTHHGVFDLSYLRHIPNVTIMAPRDENELRHMMFTAVQLGGPAVVRYPRGRGPGVRPDSELRRIPVGKAEVLRPIRPLTVLAVGDMVRQAATACDLLAEQGIEAGLVDMRFVKPIDRQLLAGDLAGCRRLVTVEDNVLAGGFGSAVLEVLADEQLAIPVLRLGWPDEFIVQGSRDQLFNRYQLDAAAIARRIAAWYVSGPVC
ncbi:MAG: 1-deoxy-D-xylulose-5-phosphate synthase [Negativicutes bacterium]|nr:1-deoxy-D-xylulose-5-phosphate synthase [Negativicutes bacterium]